MNEKKPKLQTQAAMTEARAMARDRMHELTESTLGVESFPSFTKPARQRWESIPADIRQRLLSNVWCGQCRHVRISAQRDRPFRHCDRAFRAIVTAHFGAS